MKILVKLKLIVDTVIDLTDYGYDEFQNWDDLTEIEQNEILDPIRETAIPDVSIETIDD